MNLDALPLARYVEYVTLPFAAKVKDGALTTRLKIAFVTDKGVPKTLKVSGTAHVDRFALTRNDGTPLAAAAKVDVTIGEADALARTVAIERIAVDAPNVDLRRLSDGALEFVRLITPAAPAPPAARAASATAAAPAQAWTLRVADARISNGTLALSDASIDPAFAATLTGVALTATGLSTADAPPARIELAFDSDGARFDGKGELDVRKLAGRGNFALSKFSLARLYPCYAAALALDVKRGSLALAGDFDVAAGTTPLQMKLTGGSATLTDLELAVSDEKEPLWRIPSLALAGIDFDLAQHRVTIDSVDGPRAAMRVIREADGTINFARLVRTTAQTGAGTPAGPGAPAAGSADATWAYAVRRITLERATADVEDRGVVPPVKQRLTDVRAVGQNFSNARGAKGTLDFRARVGNSGKGCTRRLARHQPLRRRLAGRCCRRRSHALSRLRRVADEHRLHRGCARDQGSARPRYRGSGRNAHDLRGRRDDQRLRRPRPADQPGARPLEDADADRGRHRERAAAPRARRRVARRFLRADHRQRGRDAESAVADGAARRGGRDAGPTYARSIGRLRGQAARPLPHARSGDCASAVDRQRARRSAPRRSRCPAVG